MKEYRNQLIEFKEEIQKFEDNYVKNNFINYNDYEHHKGYLINLENYNDLKNKIETELKKSINVSLAINNLNILKSIEFKNSTYLLNMLFNGNEYIIINTALWNLFGVKENTDAKFYYSINNGIIIFSLDDNIKLKFTCWNHNNIIKKSSFSFDNNNKYYEFESNYERIDNIYNSIFEYSKIETQIEFNLKNNQKKTEFGYLITENWIQKWMEQLNYRKFKQEFQNFQNPKKNKDIIINYEAKFGKIKINLKNLDTKSFESKKDMEKFLKNNSLVLANSTFISFLNIYYDVKNMIRYDINKNFIEFHINGEVVSVESKNNIITLKKNIINKLKDESDLIEIHLKILIKIFCFRKEIEAQINSENKKGNNINNKIFFVNKEWMNQYKKFFDYPKIYGLLNSSPVDTDHNNIENYYQNLIQLIKTYKKEYLEEIDKKFSSGQFKFTEQYNHMKYKINKPGNKQIEYLIDFDIINEEIISLFEQNEIIKKEKLISGEYIACEKKILFYYEKDNNKYYQIDVYDNNTDEFIIEYLIGEDYTTFVKIYFEEKGFNILLTNIINNQILLKNISICSCYKIFGNQSLEEEQDMNISNKLNDDEKDIFNLLLSYGLFQMDVQKKLNDFQLFQKQNITIPQINNYYLVNTSIVEEFINSFWNEKINEIIRKYNLNYQNNIDDLMLKNILNDKLSENCIKAIIDNKDIFKSKVKHNDIYKIETLRINEKNSIFYYPKDLLFLDKLLASKFINLFELLNFEQKEKNSKIVVNFNNGNLVFKGNENLFLNNSENLIYVYSLNKEITKGMNFNLEFILSFNYYNDLINDNFINILKNNIFLSCLNHSSDFESKFKLKIHLINKKLDKNSENKLNENLEILSNLNKEIIILKKKSATPINNSSTSYYKTEEYYLINQNFIKNLEDIIHFTEIKTIINNDNQFYRYFEFDKKKCLNKMKSYLSDDIKKDLMNFENNPNLVKLKNIQTYKLEYSLFKTKYKYYPNSIIINNKIKELLSDFVKLSSSIIEPIECYFDNNKIFINFKPYIAVGNIEESNQIIFSHFIEPIYPSDFQIIVEKIKSEGYKLIQKGLGFGKLQFKSYYGLDIQAEIVNISQKNQINKSNISEKLKKLILLCFGIQSNGDIGLNDKLAEEVYLISPEILSEPCLIEINSLLQNNNKVINLLSEFNFPKYGLNSTQLEELISNLNEQKLKLIDNKYPNKTFQFLEPKGQNMTLKNHKDIVIYREFIMIKKNIFFNISSELGLNNIPKVFYSKNKEGDIIIDENKECIIYGRIDENNFFNVKYIFYFSYGNDLEGELKKIGIYGIKKYLDDNTVFNKENSNDCISPIFSNKNILGDVYRVNPGINNYKNKMDYSAYLQNSNLIRSYLLYDNYEKIKEKMNYNFSHKKEYYLIKKQAMKDIKKIYYYKDIKEILDKINPNERKLFNQSKLLLYLLKNLPENIFEEFIKEGDDIKKMDKGLIEPDIEPVYLSKDQAYMIYKDFEMIEPEIAKKFFKDLNEGSYLSFTSKDNNITECILKDGKVMVKYTPSLFNNQKDIVSIGNISNDYTFINEYVLIYNKFFSSHMSELEKTNLNKYLRELKFVNNQNPIVINEYIDIGTIIKLNPQTNNGKINDYDDFDDDFDDDNDDGEYNLNPPKKYNSVKECFIYPPLIGLDNIGATCYMNATLQCLCNIEKFVDYFKFNSHLIKTVKNDTGKSKLCSSFKLLIENLWPDPDKKNKKKSKTSIGFNRSFPYQVSNKYESETFYGGNKNNKSYPPEEFKKKISKMNPLFEGVAANDAKDLVQFLIMTLHKELNKAGESNVNNAINLDQRNKQLMFQVFAQDFMNSNKSVISDLFYGVNYNITQCGFCNTQTFNYQTYFFLIFPLEEVRIFKSQNNINYNYNCFANNEVNIYDCFFYDQKINYMTGSNIMYCNFCRQTCNTSMRTILSTGPEILIIILNRGQGIQFNVKINFLEEINLENFIEMKQTGCIYKLIGVITHIGESGMGGHFIAYSKNPISNEWNKYNDSIVSPVSNFKKDVIDFAMPYLLFYQKST